jgi:hypothetical protein
MARWGAARVVQVAPGRPASFRAAGGGAVLRVPEVWRARAGRLLQVVRVRQAALVRESG